MSLRAIALVPLLVATVGATSWAREAPVRSAPFDFSLKKPTLKKKGIVERILERVDGGDFHGYDSPDGTTRKAEDPLGTKTVRLQLHF
ncbi:MAG TPA: hypothetical protein VN947_33725 [Polyangia bacterium]|nr:hypothetical protein [Polyangia bacterium]